MDANAIIGIILMIPIYFITKNLKIWFERTNRNLYEQVKLAQRASRLNKKRDRRGILWVAKKNANALRKMEQDAKC